MGPHFCQSFLISNKIMVYITTGQNEYWPIYMSIGDIHDECTIMELYY